ncbi:slipin family protein [Candidatus Thorarchaeota archaeon]|nr:MAG: slipin family protein [Candidatus Thorarchaeota archaeon]
MQEASLLVMGMMALVVGVFLLIIVVAASVRIVKEYERAIVFRLGRFVGQRGPGVFWIIPGLDRLQVVDLRTVTYDARTIKVITKDNIRCDVDSFVFYRVVDPERAILEVENYIRAVQNLAKTVLRDVLGTADLDDLLSHTEELTLRIHREIDRKTDPWGIKVTDVAISDILLPEEMQRAIAKQAEAERERRARIIIAEGEYMAAEKMVKAAEMYAASPITFKIRELQTLAEIAREKNLVVVTTTGNSDEIARVFAVAQGTDRQQQQQRGK